MKNNNELIEKNKAEQEKFLLELKADIEQAKKEYLAGDFITHEEMLKELKKKKLIK